MTVYAVYHGRELVCRTRDLEVAERVRASVAGRIDTIERAPTFAERQAAA